MKSILTRIIYFLFILLVACVPLVAQYVMNINFFPFEEGFKANDNVWLSGDFCNDWVWGTPTKPVLSVARRYPEMIVGTFLLIQ